MLFWRGYWITCWAKQAFGKADEIPAWAQGRYIESYDKSVQKWPIKYVSQKSLATIYQSDWH